MERNIRIRVAQWYIPVHIGVQRRDGTLVLSVGTSNMGTRDQGILEAGAHHWASVWALLLLLSFASGSAWGALLSIAAPQFSGSVSDDGKFTISNPATNGAISRRSLQDGYLYFSFTVLAGEKAINYLLKNGALPIKVTAYAGWTKLGDYDVGISPDNWRKNRKQLIQEFQAMGYFTWRTYMQTSQVEHSSITVKISDPNSDYVAPVDEAGAFELTITIIP